MKYLNKLLNCIVDNSKPYSIPSAWNISGCAGTENEGFITVNAKEYFTNSINNIVSQPEQDVRSDIAGSCVYSMLPSVQTAWDHYGDGICGGTFLKCIATLPLIKRLGVDIIYLLPVFEGSDLFKKGEKSSPYSIKNIMKIDPKLHDEHLPDMTADEEFRAFVEACHHLGIRVMMDFVFRTAARDSALLLEHPDWFYWIKSEYADTIAAPGVDGIGHQAISLDNVPLLYNSPDMNGFVSCFVDSPDSELWQSIVSSASGDSSQALINITENHGICTMAGFADTINDPQPPWTDITYLKFYYDNSPYSSVLNADLPPFIAQDGIKCSLFPGNQPNLGLWEYIKNVIPHYIDMGIDGARIDMGHALPTELNSAIAKAAFDKKPDFFFWSEQFDPQNASAAKQEGSSFITGDMLFMWKTKTPCMRALSVKDCINAPLPFTACCETADTPRASLMVKTIDNVKAAIYQCALMPNSVFFINSGLELDEIQPMNLGLLNDESGRWVLPKNHPMYGRLAFFDNFVFDWCNYKSAKGGKWLREAALLRKKYAHIIKSEYFNSQLFFKRGAFQVIQYCNGAERLTVYLNHSAKRADLAAKLKDKKYAGFILPVPDSNVILNRGDIYICEEKL